MNFWASIEHSLNYKYEGQIPEGIKDRLKQAAEAAAWLDGQMSEIRDEIAEAQKTFESKYTFFPFFFSSLRKSITPS